MRLSYSRSATLNSFGIGLFCLLSLGSVIAQSPLGPAITYQGLVVSAGTPASGSHDLQFTLFDDAAGGVVVAGPICVDNVDLIDGQLTVQLDFGASAFSGEARWLEIGVRADSSAGNCGAGTYTILSPRQMVTAAPYSHFSTKPWTTSGNDISTTNAGNVGIGTASPGSKLAVAGVIESTVGGVRFPDGTTQLTAGASLPTGVIVMWSGSLTSVPAGWALCDGSNGTPDLRNRFIFGTAADEQPGATGGSSNHTHITPTHRHTISFPGASVNAPLPAHTHAVPGQNVFVPLAQHQHLVQPFQGGTGGPTASAGAAAGGVGVASTSHTHSVTIPGHTTDPSQAGAGSSISIPPGATNPNNPDSITVQIPQMQWQTLDSEGGGTSDAANHLPPYFKLAFLMKL